MDNYVLKFNEIKACRKNIISSRDHVLQETKPLLEHYSAF